MKRLCLPLFVLVIMVAAGCTSVNYSANMVGVSDYTAVVAKDFTAVGIVTVLATETHHSGPLGFFKSVDGSKITYSALMNEAEALGADDIINIRIDVNSNYQSKFCEWIIGWDRTYNYTGTALAIKYTEKLETQNSDPHFHEIPKAPEKTRVVKTGRDGQTALR